MLQDLSRAIVRSYPLAWRERYDDEVQALIDAGAIRARDVLDLLRGRIRERVLSLYEPGRHISAFRLISGITLITWLTTLLVGSLLLSLAPLGTGYLLKVTLGPGDGLFDALGRLRSARYDLRWARMELERCEGRYEGRVPGPELRAARAEMKRLTGEEADALAALDTMGYHSRFKAS